MNIRSLKTYCARIRNGDTAIGKMKRSPTAQSYTKPTDARSFINHIFTGRRWITFRKNKYSYDVAQDVKHYVLWFHPSKFDCVPDGARVCRIIGRTFPRATYSSAWFQNPTEWRSVRFIPHVHVFVTRRHRPVQK